MVDQSSGTTEEVVLADADLAMSAVPDAPDAGRSVVFVAGSGRSGTSLMSGILKHMGLHVPQPEVAADNTNPKGFGEPQWVVDFHNELLRRVVVHASDARPAAWFDAGKAGMREHNRSELSEWLAGQFAEGGDHLVVKDPRIAWFLGLWRVAAVRNGATTSTITMLRPPAEVVGSKNQYYGGRLGDIERLAGWINVMLCTERATRGTPRSFVRYHDLLEDWTRTVVRVGDELRISQIQTAGVARMQEIHSFVDPGLRRVRLDWSDLNVPGTLLEVAQESWEALNALAEPDSDTPAAHARLDAARAAYGELYAEAEALAASSIMAAGPHHLRAVRAARAKELEEEAAAAYESATGPRKVYLRTRRAAGRVKRKVQGVS